MRPGDWEPTKEELSQLDLFQRLKRIPSIEKFPGAVCVRWFPARTAVCRQGQEGNSAFYILTREDTRRMLGVRRRELQQALESSSAESAEVRERLAAELGRLEVALGELGEADVAGEQRARMATAYLVGGDAPIKRSPGLLGRVARFVMGTSSARPLESPKFIPNDGPSDIDYGSREAPMFEGDVFGEMSCMTLAPRSATVITDTNCYMLEFLRNIFDQIQRDPGYKEKMDKIYADRVLSTHLDRLRFFQGLTRDQLQIVRRGVELESREPGEVICDEGDPSDCVYIVRTGLVQVLVNVNVGIRAEQVGDFPHLARDLMDLAGDPFLAALVPTKRVPGAGAASPGVGSKPAMSVADVLAAAGKQPADRPKGPSSNQSTGPSGQRPSKFDPAAKSVADILAAARNKPAEKPSVTGQAPETGTPPAAGKVVTTGDSTAEDDSAQEGSHVARRTLADALDDQLRQHRERIDSGHRWDGPAVEVADGPPSPRRLIWSHLSAEAQRSCARLARDAGDDADRRTLAAALTRVMRNRSLLTAGEMKSVLLSPDVRATVESFPKGIEGAKSQWSDVEVRLALRLVMQTLYPGSFPRRKATAGPPRTLAYLSRGDCFGELGVLFDQPRNATCIAYDHPPDESGRKSGRVELVRIGKDTFTRLLDAAPELREKVTQLAKQRAVVTQQEAEAPAWDATDSVLFSPEYRDAGFAQGQKLMLIDLDRCTNCGDCVRACINTHEDGYSRLFLDGPRFDRFLVPSACRNCMDPACMIGCPVGSIQRGADGQIIIRDWCIGCSLCARQCPYDSIQMHDVGLITLRSGPWHILPAASAATTDWKGPRANDSRWPVVFSPIHWDLDVQHRLRQHDASFPFGDPRLSQPLITRLHFSGPDSWGDKTEDRYRLLIESTVVAEAWVNGHPVDLIQDARQKKKGEYEGNVPETWLKRNENVLAVRLTPAGESQASLAYDELLLSARLDKVPKLQADSLAGPLTVGDGATVELVTEKAVVCDLCMTLSQPACVAECPHDAAMRIDARLEFPAH